MCAEIEPDEPSSEPVSSASSRAHAAWRTWLAALATNAEAAMAAALAYESLDSAARDAWLDVLEQDAPGLAVPALALYAPLLSVETDEGRRTRMADALMPFVSREAREVRALRGTHDDSGGGDFVWVLVQDVYLEFVDVLVCRYDRDEGFVAVERDPLRHIGEVTIATGSVVHGVPVEQTPVRVVIEEMAHAIVAERRAGRPLPDALGAFAHLFGPDIDELDSAGLEGPDSAGEILSCFCPTSMTRLGRDP